MLQAQLTKFEKTKTLFAETTKFLASHMKDEVSSEALDIYRCINTIIMFVVSRIMIFTKKKN